MSRISTNMVSIEDKFYLSNRNGFLKYITAGRGVAYYYIAECPITGIETLRLFIDDDARRAIGVPQSIEDVQSWLEPTALKVARFSYLELKEKRRLNAEYSAKYRLKSRLIKKYVVTVGMYSKNALGAYLSANETHSIEAVSVRGALKKVRNASKILSKARFRLVEGEKDIYKDSASNIHVKIAEA